MLKSVRVGLYDETDCIKTLTGFCVQTQRRVKTSIDEYEVLVSKNSSKRVLSDVA